MPPEVWVQAQRILFTHLIHSDLFAFDVVHIYLGRLIVFDQTKVQSGRAIIARSSAFVVHCASERVQIRGNYWSICWVPSVSVALSAITISLALECMVFLIRTASCCQKRQQIGNTPLQVHQRHPPRLIFFVHFICLLFCAEVYLEWMWIVCMPTLWPLEQI